MSGHREVRYATPVLKRWGCRVWWVFADPWEVVVGQVQETDAGWTAYTAPNRYAGLYPDMQAAAEVLVKQAGYELGEVGQ